MALLSCPWWQRLSVAGTPGLSGVVKKLGAALSRHTAGQEEGEAISHLWSRMGNGHPPSARQRRHPRQPGACPALGAHRRNYLKCNTFMKPLECTLFALSHVDDQFVHYSLKYTPHTK